MQLSQLIIVVVLFESCRMYLGMLKNISYPGILESNIQVMCDRSYKPPQNRLIIFYLLLWLVVVWRRSPAGKSSRFMTTLVTNSVPVMTLVTMRRGRRMESLKGTLSPLLHLFPFSLFNVIVLLHCIYVVSIIVVSK